MATPVRRAMLTYQKYLQLPDNGKRYEIIEWELYVSPAPSMKHQFMATQLTIVVGGYIGEH